MRRLPDRCYLCGDPVAVGAWFCCAHLWAQGIELHSEHREIRVRPLEGLRRLAAVAEKNGAAA